MPGDTGPLGTAPGPLGIAPGPLGTAPGPLGTAPGRLKNDSWFTASLSVRRCCHTVTLEFQPTRRLSLYFCNIQGKTVGIVTYKTMLFHWNSRALLTVGTVDSRHCCQSALLKNRHCPANGFWHCPENDSRHCPQKDSRHCPQNDSRSCVQVTVVSVRH